MIATISAAWANLGAVAGMLDGRSWVAGVGSGMVAAESGMAAAGSGVTTAGSGVTTAGSGMTTAGSGVTTPGASAGTSVTGGSVQRCSLSFDPVPGRYLTMSKLMFSPISVGGPGVPLAMKCR